MFQRPQLPPKSCNSCNNSNLPQASLSCRALLFLELPQRSPTPPSPSAAAHGCPSFMAAAAPPVSAPARAWHRIDTLCCCCCCGGGGAAGSLGNSPPPPPSRHRQRLTHFPRERQGRTQLGACGVVLRRVPDPVPSRDVESVIKVGQDDT